VNGEAGFRSAHRGHVHYPGRWTNSDCPLHEDRVVSTANSVAPQPSASRRRAFGAGVERSYPVGSSKRSPCRRRGEERCDRARSGHPTASRIDSPAASAWPRTPGGSPTSRRCARCLLASATGSRAQPRSSSRSCAGEPGSAGWRSSPAAVRASAGRSPRALPARGAGVVVADVPGSRNRSPAWRSRWTCPLGGTRAFSFLGWPAIAIGGLRLPASDPCQHVRVRARVGRAYGPPG
jgi:hypothetical protein